MRLLFVAGCPRSGTTALGEYLNLHPAILLCIERYKFLPPEKITSSLFTFDRILDYKEGETNLPRSRHVKLLRRKDPDKLQWVGDKNPASFRHYRPIVNNNPGTRFIVIHRPVEEVAESFQGRARNPNDRWPESNGFEAGVERWNQDTNYLRELMESGLEPEVLILHYTAFFKRPESYVPLLSEFLGLEFDEDLRKQWREMSRDFEERRRSKEPLTEEQREFAREHKDHEAERWIRDVIEQQRNGPVKLPRSQYVDRRVYEDKTQDLERRLRLERQTSRRLRQRNQQLEKEIPKAQDEEHKPDSKSLRFRKRLVGLRFKLLGKLNALLDRKG